MTSSVIHPRKNICPKFSSNVMQIFEKCAGTGDSICKVLKTDLDILLKIFEERFEMELFCLFNKFLYFFVK